MPSTWRAHGVRIALKAVNGDVIKKFAPHPKRGPTGDEDEGPPQKKTRECQLTQELEMLLDREAAAASSGGGAADAREPDAAEPVVEEPGCGGEAAGARGPDAAEVVVEEPGFGAARAGA